MFKFIKKLISDLGGKIRTYKFLKERDKQDKQIVSQLKNKKGVILYTPRTKDNFRILVGNSLDLKAGERLAIALSRRYQFEIPSQVIFGGLVVHCQKSVVKQITGSKREAEEYQFSIGGADFISLEEAGKIAASKEVAKATADKMACHVNF